jgi:lipopolysaccharide transport system permease protein
MRSRLGTCRRRRLSVPSLHSVGAEEVCDRHEAAPSASGRRTVNIGGRTASTWAEIWQSRDLLAFLVHRDVAVRYKQTAIGVAWSVLRPALVAAILAFVFGWIGRFSSFGVPYLLFVLIGTAPWFLFANAFQEVSHSLVNNAQLVSKVYFPRIILPASALGVHLLDFAISLGLLGVLMAWYRVPPTWRLLFIPPFAALAATVSFGPGLIVAAIHARYRDFRFIVPLVIQIGLYLSPVGYDSSLVPAQLRFYYSFNPMVGVVEAFRWCILGIEPSWSSVALAVLVSVALLILGLLIFRRGERSFADWL